MFLLIALVVIPMVTLSGQILMKHKSIRRTSPNILSSVDLYNRLREQTHQVTHCFSLGFYKPLRFRCSAEFYAKLKAKFAGFREDVFHNSKTGLSGSTFSVGGGIDIEVDPTFPIYRQYSRSERRKRRKAEAAERRRVAELHVPIVFAHDYKVVTSAGYSNIILP